MRSNLITLLSYSLFFCTLTAAAPAQDGCIHPRLVSVTGTAEIDVAPDEVVLSLGIESRDKDITIAKAQHDTRAKKLLEAAHNAGIEPKYIRTSVLQMTPDYSEEKVPRFLGYEVSQTIQLTLKDLSKYETLVTKLLEAGVNRIDGVKFLVAESRKYKDEVRLKAIRAAREKATAMAAELGQTIGKPWEISEDGSSGMYLATANSFSYANNASATESTVAPGEVSISTSVKVSFQLE